MRNFPLQGFNRHLHWFRCSGKREHLNLAARQNQAANQLTTNVLQDFRQLCPWFRCQHGLERSGMQMCPGGASGGGSTKRAAEQPGASEPERNSKNHCNTLRNFLLQGFNKHISWFRCGGKGKHLNPAAIKKNCRKPRVGFRQPCIGILPIW